MKQKYLVLSKSSRKDSSFLKPIYIRVCDGVAHDWKEKTPYFVDFRSWDSDRQEARIKLVMNPDDRELWGDLNIKLAELRKYIDIQFAKDKLANAVGDNWLSETLAKYFNAPVELSNKDIFARFLEDTNHKMADSRKKQFAVLFRSLERYEIYVRLTKPHKDKFKLILAEINSDVLDDLWSYMRDESTILDKFPEIEKQVPRRKKTDIRSTNTLVGIFKRLRSFLSWCVENRYIETNPFSDYSIASELYGTPIFITAEELKDIYKTDLSDNPHLERQRDIFVFQCNIGCRVGDLLDFKKTDVVDGFINYIPDKTITSNPRTVSVPLNGTAKAIVMKYRTLPGDQLLPFIRPQDYNDAIKLILQRAKITRQVVVLDPVTRSEKRVSIASVASSHMARRTFIGNLYNEVKDPNLISSLTGHAENSRAFTRYRSINDDIKKELVKKLE